MKSYEVNLQNKSLLICCFFGVIADFCLFYLANFRVRVLKRATWLVHDPEYAQEFASRLFLTTPTTGLAALGVQCLKAARNHGNSE